MIYILAFIFIALLWGCAAALLITENREDPSDDNNAWKDREDDDI